MSMGSCLQLGPLIQNCFRRAEPCWKFQLTACGGPPSVEGAYCCLLSAESLPGGRLFCFFSQLILLSQEHHGRRPKFFQRSKDLHEMWQVYRATYQRGRGEGVGTSSNMTEIKGGIKSCYHTCHKGQEEIWQGGKLVWELSVGCTNDAFRVAGRTFC